MLFRNRPFFGTWNSCDLYFRTRDRIVIQSQIDVFKSFKLNYKKYVSEIELYVTKSLTSLELKRAAEIEKAVLYLDIIEIPQGNLKYDLVLICSKSYKKFLRNKSIDIRVKFQDGKIKSILRTTDTMKENA